MNSKLFGGSGLRADYDISADIRERSKPNIWRFDRDLRTHARRGLYLRKLRVTFTGPTARALFNQMDHARNLDRCRTAPRVLFVKAIIFSARVMAKPC